MKKRVVCPFCKAIGQTVGEPLKPAQVEMVYCTNCKQLFERCNTSSCSTEGEDAPLEDWQTSLARIKEIV